MRWIWAPTILIPIWVGDKYKHHWTPGFRDRFAYAPSDITEPWHPGGGVAAILRRSPH